MSTMNTATPTARKRRPHPARRARRLTGAAGIATVAVLTGCMAAGAATRSSAATATDVDTSTTAATTTATTTAASTTAATTADHACKRRHRQPLPTLRRRAAETSPLSSALPARAGTWPRDTPPPSLGVAGSLLRVQPSVVPVVGVGIEASQRVPCGADDVGDIGAIEHQCRQCQGRRRHVAVRDRQFVAGELVPLRCLEWRRRWRRWHEPQMAIGACSRSDLRARAVSMSPQRHVASSSGRGPSSAASASNAATPCLHGSSQSGHVHENSSSSPRGISRAT